MNSQLYIYIVIFAVLMFVGLFCVMEVWESKRQNRIHSKNNKLLNEFAKYCKDNPDQRFWQALRNWAGVDGVFIGHYNQESGEQFNSYEDTFYRDEK